MKRNDYKALSEYWANRARRVEAALQEIAQRDWEVGDGWALARAQEELPGWEPDMSNAVSNGQDEPA